MNKKDSFTFGELFGHYYERHVKINNRNISNSKSIWKLYLCYWKDIQVSEISRRDVQDWLDEIIARSPTVAQRAIAVMKATINWGIQRGYINSTNPCEGIKLKKFRSRDRYLKPYEVARFMASLEMEEQIFQDLFSICLFTAARKGRVLATRWDEVDLELAIWQFDNKNGDVQFAPLITPALEILKRRWLNRTSEWVFPGRYGIGHLTNIDKSFQRVIKRAKLDGGGKSKPRIHDLRRTHLSMMAINGESLLVIGAMAGHKDPRATAIYARMNVEPVREAAEKVFESWNKVRALPNLEQKIADKTPKLKSSDAAHTPISKLTATELIIIESKILTTLRMGHGTKTAMYKRIGGDSIKVDKFELDRILDSMINRNLICKYKDELNWSYWRFALVNQPPKVSRTSKLDYSCGPEQMFDIAEKV